MIAQLDGWTEKTGDWLLSSRLRGGGYAPGEIAEFECEQNYSNHSCKRANLIGPNAVGGYSFGGSTFYDETKGFSADDPYDVVVLVAPVPDWSKGQCGSWPAVKFTNRMYCFQVTPSKSFPVSEPIDGAPWFNINDVDLKAKLLANPVANINCDSLFANETDKIKVHSTVQNHPDVLSMCVWIFRTFSPPLPSCAPPAPLACSLSATDGAGLGGA